MVRGAAYQDTAPARCHDCSSGCWSGAFVCCQQTAESSPRPAHPQPALLQRAALWWHTAPIGVGKKSQEARLNSKDRQKGSNWYVEKCQNTFAWFNSMESNCSSKSNLWVALFCITPPNKTMHYLHSWRNSIKSTITDNRTHVARLNGFGILTRLNLFLFVRTSVWNF